MKVLSWVTFVALVLLAFFAVANWSLMIEPVPLSFLLFTAHGPLGLILLAAILGFAVLFAVYAVSLRTTALIETRRHLKELEAQRDLADKAEASRFTALGSQLEQESTRLRATIEASRAEVLQRVNELEQSLASGINDAANSLAANVGQVDDKLNRIGSGADPRLPPPRVEM
jgi:uncharacterized integral membrane protein